MFISLERLSKGSLEVVGAELRFKQSALVFLVKGIKRPFKQPITSFYCDKRYNVDLMENEIREAVNQLHDANTCQRLQF